MKPAIHSFSALIVALVVFSMPSAFAAVAEDPSLSITPLPILPIEYARAFTITAALEKTDLNFTVPIQLKNNLFMVALVHKY